MSFLGSNHLNYKAFLLILLIFAREKDKCVRQHSLLLLMAKVIAKLEQLSKGQKDMLSKLKLIRKNNKELLRGQKRLEQLIKDKYDKNKKH